MRRLSPLAQAGLATVPCAPAYADTLLIGTKGADTVGFVDLASGRECIRVATGRGPHEVTVSPNGRQAGHPGSNDMKAPKTVAALNDFGRIRLSQHFYMRDFLFSDIAAVHGLHCASRICRRITG